MPTHDLLTLLRTARLGRMGAALALSFGTLTMSTHARPAQGTATEVNCCNTRDGQWIGAMAPAACLRQTGHFPDIETYSRQIKACGPDSPATGDPATTAIEDNIPNGGFETWSGTKPVGFATFSTPPGSPIAIETVERSTDAHTGQYSALIQNKRMEIPGMPAGFSIPGMPGGPTMPGGLVSCKDNCPINTGQRMGSDRAALDSTTFPITDYKDNFCGYYKSTLVGGDKVFLSLVTRSGSTIVGGTNASMTEASSYITQSVTSWTPFRLPIVARPGHERSTPTNGVLEIMIVPGGFNPSAMQPAAMGNPGSQIYVDSLHFCGARTDLEVRRPNVLGGTVIPEAEEDTIGVQTFPNFDNDDRDDKFDFEDDDGVIGDDELVPLTMKVSPEADGEGELRVLSGGNAVRVWATADKTSLFTPLNTPFNIRDVLELDPLTGDRRKRVWLEGIEASTEARNIRLEFTYRPKNVGPEEKDAVSMTVVGVSGIVWRGRGNSENDDDTLTRDPLTPSSVDIPSFRVFPDRRAIGGFAEPNPRDVVAAEVTLSVKPVRPVTLYFAAYDVDDPTVSNEPLDGETEANDNRGLTPNPWGTFPESLSRWLSTTFTEQQQRILFQTTMQPGDNFRIVASSDPVYLADLDNPDHQLGNNTNDRLRIVDVRMLEAGKSPKDAEIPHADKYVSDLLTVWRHVHLEVDRMDTVQGNTVRGRIVSVNRNILSLGGSTTLELDKNFYDLHRTAQGTAGLANMFEYGTIEIAGHGVFDVIGNSANAEGNDTVIVQGSVPSAAVGATFALNDDDEQQGFKDGGEVPLPDFSRLEPVFKQAFIVPVFDKLSNLNPIVPYAKNSYDDRGFHLRRAYQFDNRQYDTTEDFWVVYVLAAHQGITTEDGDGETRRVSGEVDRINGMGLHVYIGGHRDLHGFASTNSSGTGQADVVAHEIAHLFGAEHGEDGLIDQRSNELSDNSLDKIRRVRHP